MLDRTSGIIIASVFFVIYAAGMIAGMIQQEKKKKKSGNDLDERQKIIEGKAWQYGFMTSLGAGVYVSFLNRLCEEPLSERSVELWLVLLLGLFVGMEYQIWNDAWLGTRTKPVRGLLALLLLTAVIGAVIFLLPFRENAVKDGRLQWAGFVIICFGSLCLNTLTALARVIYLKLRDRE